MPQQSTVLDDTDLLLDILPPRVREALDMSQNPDLLEIVMDLGRLPEARYAANFTFLTSLPVTREDLEHVTKRIGQFGDDHRAGIERTLHRISAMANRRGEVVGLTCRVGRAVIGTIEPIRAVVESGKSVLLLGRPGVGKTTMLREAARVLADDLGKRVMVVDTSNEIAGDGDIPHPGIGHARRMQVSTPARQAEVMIEAVENHMPEVIVIDEIGTQAEAEAARTIAERGVQLIGTAHGNTLDNLVTNPTLSDLVGGIHAVTLSDEEARRRRTQKTILERKAPPTFDVIVELRSKDELAIHHDVGAVIDSYLRGEVPQPEVQRRGQAGALEVVQLARVPEAPTSFLPSHASPRLGRRSESRSADTQGTTRSGLTTEPAVHSDPDGLGRAVGPANVQDSGARAVAPPSPNRVFGARGAPAPPARPSAPASVSGASAGGASVRVFAYGVSRNLLERAAADFRLPLEVVHDVEEANLAVTLKAQMRKLPSRVREAERRGLPLYVVRANTQPQVANLLEGLARSLAASRGTDSAATDILAEAEQAARKVLTGADTVELAPTQPGFRRLQHQVAERYGLNSTSVGLEPNRRVVLYRNLSH